MQTTFNKTRLVMAVAIVFVGIISGAQEVCAAQPAKAFTPVETWADVSGKPINAHGGGMLFHDGVYYWYGEFKEGRTWSPRSNRSWGGTRVVAMGVSCYSSTNLYDWKFEGVALPSVAKDRSHDLHSSKVIERPKVLYNRATKKFVMWLHIDSEDYKAARSGVAGWLVKTQRERGLFYQNFTLGLLESKVCVGWHWFCYSDNDQDDKSVDPSNRDSNKGIVNNRYEPYAPLLTAMKPLNESIYSLADYFDRVETNRADRRTPGEKGD